MGKLAVVSWRLCADKACVQTSGNCGVSGAFDDGAAVGKERHLKAVSPEFEDEVIVLYLTVRLEAHGHLGRYGVKWYRSIAAEGTISQSALIPLDDYWQVDIRVSAKRQVDVDQLIETIGHLPLFTNPPRHIPAEHPW